MNGSQGVGIFGGGRSPDRRPPEARPGVHCNSTLWSSWNGRNIARPVFAVWRAPRGLWPPPLPTSSLEEREGLCRVPSHLSLLPEAPTLLLGIPLEFISFLLPSRRPPSQSLQVIGTSFPCSSSQFRAPGMVWTLVSASLVLWYGFPGPLGNVSFMCRIWRILLISFLPSVFCYWFLLPRKNH